MTNIYSILQEKVGKHVQKIPLNNSHWIQCI